MTDQPTSFRTAFALLREGRFGEDMAQHEGRLDEAAPVLEEALADLDPAERDALVGGAT